MVREDVTAGLRFRIRDYSGRLLGLEIWRAECTLCQRVKACIFATRTPHARQRKWASARQPETPLLDDCVLAHEDDASMLRPCCVYVAGDRPLFLVTVATPDI